MQAGCSSAVLVSLSLLLACCGGAVEDEPSASSTKPGDARPPETKVANDAPPPKSRAVNKTPQPATHGVVWIHGEAAGFDPRACTWDTPPEMDFIEVGTYLSEATAHAGLAIARIAGGGVCSTIAPTSMSITYVYKGTAAAAKAFEASPPAPFRGRYVSVPFVVKDVRSVTFEFFVTSSDTRALERVWVHEGIDFDGEAGFMADICNAKAAFDAAVAASPISADLKAWLADPSTGSVYRLGYDATFTFADGTREKVTKAAEASAGPNLAPCPNFAAPPPSP